MKSFEEYRIAGIQLASELEEGVMGVMADKPAHFKFRNGAFFRSVDVKDPQTDLFIGVMQLHIFVGGLAYKAWVQTPERMDGDEDVKSQEVRVLTNSIIAARTSTLRDRHLLKIAAITDQSQITKLKNYDTSIQDNAASAYSTFDLSFQKLNEMCDGNELTDNQVFEQLMQQFEPTKPEA